MRTARRLLPVLVLLLVAGPAAGQTRAGEHWVTTWATAVVGRPTAVPPANAPAPATPPLTVTNQTLRQIVRTTIGGSRLRVVLSNAFGTAPLAIGAAHVAPRASDAAIGAGRPLTFSGKPGFTIPAGAVVVSDPVDLAVKPLTLLAIDVHVPGELGAMGSPLTLHANALQTNYVSAPGNHAGAAAFPVAAKMASWFLLSRVEVVAAPTVPVIALMGDSITDGSRSTPETYNRWADHLAARLLALPGPGVGVANLGIGGNRLLSEGAGQLPSNALSRFDRDVLMQSGVTHVVIMEGINDIGNTPAEADAIIAAQQQLITRARARGLRVYGATLLPYENATLYAWTKEGEAKRQAVNNWIRTSGAYDAVIDFDAVVRDPQQPTRIRAEFDSGDHLHPNDAGYKAMANAVDLRLFTLQSGS